jgi:hypothetical protein
MFEFWAKSLGGDLSGHGKFARGRIGRDKLHFIDADGRIFVIAKAFLNLLGEVLRLGATHGKSTDQTRKVVDRNFVGKKNAGESRRRQQLGETALGLSGFERNAIEQKFIVGDAEKKTSVTAFGHCQLQFFPCGLKLPFGAFVVHSIEPGVLDQNIEAMEERARGSAAAGIGWSGVSDNSLLSIGGAFLITLSGKVT